MKPSDRTLLIHRLIREWFDDATIELAEWVEEGLKKEEE